MILFECRYKYTEEDNQKGSMTTYKYLRHSGWALVFEILMWVIVGCTIAGLVAGMVYSAVSKNQIDLDYLPTIICELVFVVLWLLLPVIQKNAARSVYRKNLADKDEIVVLFDESRCITSFYKNGEETNKQIIELNTISTFIEDKDYLTIIFDKRIFVLVKKQYLNGDLGLLKKLLNSYINKK